MTEAHFRFSTDILRRLGEELNPSPDQGILELVKNAHDADAKACTVELIRTSEPGGTIRIEDNGDGMDLAGIRDGWLVLGRSSKHVNVKTRLGRTPAGSKGLGRLAALRLGSKVVMTTRPRGKEAEYTLSIDWNDFDGVQVVENVGLEIASRRKRPSAGQGTIIEIGGLHSRIGRRDAKKLSRALILLSDPFGDEGTSFHPSLRSDEYPDLGKLVEKQYFDDADYHLVARVGESGRASATAYDWRGKVLFRGAHADLAIRRGGNPYSCPTADFDFYTFLLKKDAFVERSSTLSEVRKWLEELGGVHLYQNGLRVSPYGNAGNDWLDMNLRRVQTPEERPSTNNSIGRVSVHDTKSLLVQKTDRSGFIESDAFEELRRFAADALDWLAKHRLMEAERRRVRERAEAPKQTETSRENVERIIGNAPKKSREALSKAFDAYDKQRAREVSQLQREVQLYRTLSTAGITAATFAHESRGNPLKVIVQATKAIDRRGRKSLSNYDDLLRGPVESIQGAVNSLSVLGTVTLQLVEHGKRRIGRVEINAVLQRLATTFAPFALGRSVGLELALTDQNPYMRGSEAALESILTNLLNNSLAAFETSSSSARTVRIETGVHGENAKIAVSDNGPGIVDIDRREIWLPGHTTRPNGTGLGLTIVRDAVRDLGGRIELKEPGDLGGATFIVELPILGS